jgi:hypothetical protein
MVLISWTTLALAQGTPPGCLAHSGASCSCPPTDLPNERGLSFRHVAVPRLLERPRHLCRPPEEHVALRSLQELCKALKGHADSQVFRSRLHRGQVHRVSQGPSGVLYGLRPIVVRRRSQQHDRLRLVWQQGARSVFTAHQCPPGTKCVRGECSCPAGQTACPTGCVNMANDNKNCGSCGTSVSSVAVPADGSATRALTASTARARPTTAARGARSSAAETVSTRRTTTATAASAMPRRVRVVEELITVRRGKELRQWQVHLAHSSFKQRRQVVSL